MLICYWEGFDFESKIYPSSQRRMSSNTTEWYKELSSRNLLVWQVWDSTWDLPRFKVLKSRRGLYFVLHTVNSDMENEKYYFLQCKTHCRLRFRKSFVSPAVRKWRVWVLIFSSVATACVSDSPEIICKTHSCVWRIECLPPKKDASLSALTTPLIQDFKFRCHLLVTFALLGC
jgi:hypothetical protein